jgi:WD40 repeat protein
VDAATGAEHQTLKSRMAIFFAAFSANGARVVTAGYQKVTEMEAGYFATTGSAVQEWAVHPSKDPAPDLAPPDPQLIREVRVSSADGSRQAAWSLRTPEQKPVTEIRIRDRAGKQIVVFSKHTAQIRTYPVFSPDGRLVFSRASNGEVKIWETDSGRVRWEANLETLFNLDQHDIVRVSNAPGGIAFSPDGRLLTLPSPEGVKIVGTADFRENSLVEGTSATLFPWPGCSFSPDSRRLVIFKSPPPRQPGIQPQPAGKYELKLWDVEARREIECATSTVQAGPVAFSGHVAFSPDSRIFAIHLTPRGSVTIIDAATGKRRSVLQHRVAASSAILFSPDGARVLLQTRNGPPGAAPTGPTVWDTATGKLLFRLEGDGRASFLLVAFSPDGKRIATAALQPGVITTIKVWDAATGRELLSLKGDAVLGPHDNLSFSPDGHRLLLQRPNGEGPSWDATPRPEAAKQP